ncbi:winged helix-turn-helix domain-containing protein [Microbacterium sp. MTN4-26]|uniref:winged helix-turn-helix domain-containing protein n=1 Tax=unclassified Microbacterium TaxID=2609290 RepID=UPI0036F3D524
MSTLTSPVVGSARVVVLSTDPHVARGTVAEFRHFGASLIRRTDIISALTELIRDPHTILLVSSDVACQDIAAVLELSIATSKSTVLFGIHPSTGIATVDTAIAAGVGGVVDLPLTPERLASALRQLPPASVEVPSTVAVGALLVDTDRHRVELYGTPITTTPREFDILLALATSHPRIVTLDELAHTHGGGTQRQASIRVMVAGLRSRFAALTGAPRDAVIETHRGIGYRLAA